MPFGIQPIHIIIVVIVALVIFGPSRLPEFGRSLGRTINEFRRGAQEMTDGLRQEITNPDGTPVTDMPTANNQVPFQPPSSPISQTPITPQPAPISQAFVQPESVSIAGTSQTDKAIKGNYCIQCGSSNVAEARYCNQCGASLPK